MPDESLSIVSCTVSDFKKIQVVRLNAAREVVQVTGENGAGKSSFMEAIICALAGKTRAPAMPVRRGAKSSKVEIDLGAFTRTDRYIAKTGNHTVELRAKDGEALGHPRARLDSLIGAGLALDPVAFMDKSPAEKRQVLLELIGVDLTAFAKLHKKAYDQRTEVNRDLVRAKSRIGEPVEAPDQEVSLSALSRELSDAIRSQETMQALKKELAEATANLERIQKMHVVATAKATASGDAVGALEDPAIEPILHRIGKAEGVNRRVRLRQEREEAVAEVAGLQKVSDGLTRSIAAIEEEKGEKLEAAKMPVEGLVVRDEGLWYGKLPLEQAETSKVIQICTQIAAAMAPKLGIVFVKAGNDLSPKTYHGFVKICKKLKLQLWIERYAPVGEEGVIEIVEGEVADG